MSNETMFFEWLRQSDYVTTAIIFSEWRRGRAIATRQITLLQAIEERKCEFNRLEGLS